MSLHQDQDDAFLWENQSWATLSNDTPENSGGDKVVVVPKIKEEEKKRARDMEKKGKKKVGEKRDGDSSDHELHIWTERERRKKMRNMFSNLHSLLPQFSTKADKSTIVDQAVNYIKTLHSTIQRLENQKQERLQGGPNTSLSFEHSVAATSRLAMLSSRETFMADQVSSMNNFINNNNSTNPRASTMFSASASYLPVIIQTWTSPNVVLNICGNDAQFSIYAPKRLGLFSTICCILDKYQVEPISVHISSDADRTVYMIQARVKNNGAIDHFLEKSTVEEVYKQAAGELMMWVF